MKRTAYAVVDEVVVEVGSLNDGLSIALRDLEGSEVEDEVVERLKSL